MGRQIQFHALAEDCDAFFAFVRARDPVLAVLLDSDDPAVQAVGNACYEPRPMMLWNQRLLPTLHRQHTRHSGRSVHRIPYSLPVIEFTPSKAVTWAGREALLGGRLYGASFADAPAGYAKWYEALGRWLRRHFSRNPYTAFDGYVGPAALAWFTRGGVFLPWPEPPTTPTWHAFVEGQQAARGVPE
ncbi:MAG: hypothetical protein R2712_03045 [Vicinamibacterales bacterium]